MLDEPLTLAVRTPVEIRSLSVRLSLCTIKFSSVKKSRELAFLRVSFIMFRGVATGALVRARPRLRRPEQRRCSRRSDRRPGFGGNRPWFNRHPCG